MKKLIDILLTVLLTITIFLVCFSMTILNNSFVKLDLLIHNYYETVKNNIDEQIDYDHSVDINHIKNDVNNYINGFYADRIYENKISTNVENKDSELKQIYNDNIKFIKPMHNIKLYHDIFDIATIVFVIIVGYLFIKTKEKHSLNLILIISSILGIIVSGVIYVCNDYTGIMKILINDSYYFYLGINILILLLTIFKYLLKKYKNSCK